MDGQRDASGLVVPLVGQPTSLSRRQAEILQLAANGLIGKQIARQLGISARTVQDHFSRMRQRTGARTDAELVAYAAAAELLAPGSAVSQELPTGGKQQDRNRSILNTLSHDGQDGTASRRPVHERGAEKAGCRLIGPGPVSVQSPTTTTAPPAGPGAALSAGSAPWSGTVSGALVGYARVSTDGRNLDQQIRTLADAGCTRVFADKRPGKTATRPELDACLDYLRPGDILVVPSLGRLSPSLQDLITLVAGLHHRDLGFQSLHEALNTTTPGGRLVFHVFAALAEFIRELIVQGTHEGIAAARSHGVRVGRPPAMTAEQIHHAQALLTQPGNTVSSIARLLGVSRSTIYKHVPELASGSRLALPSSSAIPAQAAGSAP